MPRYPLRLRTKVRDTRLVNRPRLRFGRGVGTFVDPTSLINLFCWYDASNAGSFTLSGTDVTAWGDLSANARHLNLVTGTPSRTGTQNGLTTVLVAAGESVHRNNAGADLGAGACSIFAVVKIDAGTAGFVVTEASSTDATHSFRPMESVVTTGNFQILERAGGTQTLDDDAVDITGAFKLLRTTDTGTSLIRAVDGVATGAALSHTLLDPVTDRFALGALIRGASVFSGGTIEYAEVVAYSRVLTDAEIVLVEAYLTDKWFAEAVEYEQTLTGSITGGGTLVRSTAKAVTGSTTPAGALLVLRTIVQTLTGSITGVGALIRSALKLAVGTTTPTGAAAKATAKIHAGTVQPDGSIANTGTLAFVGSTTGSGTLSRSASKGLAGSSTPTGALAKLVSKLLTGAITPTGALEVLRTIIQSLAGSITAAGALVRATSKAAFGSTGPSGSPANLTSKGLDGEITPSGSLSFLNTIVQNLTGSITATSTLIRDTFKAAFGSTAPAGQPANATSKGLDGSVTPSGSLTVGRIITQLLTGSITAAGSLAKTVGKSLAGAVTTVGTLVRFTFKLLVGSITGSGSLTTSGGTPNVPGTICLTLEVPLVCLEIEAGCVDLEVS